MDSPHRSLRKSRLARGDGYVDLWKPRPGSGDRSLGIDRLTARLLLESRPGGLNLGERALFVSQKWIPFPTALGLDGK